MLIIKGEFRPISSIEAHLRADAIDRTRNEVIGALSALGVKHPEDRSSLVKARALAEANGGTVKWSQDLWRQVVSKMGVIIPSARMEMSGEAHLPLLVVS